MGKPGEDRLWHFPWPSELTMGKPDIADSPVDYQLGERANPGPSNYKGLYRADG